MTITATIDSTDSITAALDANQLDWDVTPGTSSLRAFAQDQEIWTVDGVEYSRSELVAWLNDADA